MAGKPTVFVVDDDLGALRSLCWLIEQADFPVRAFSSAREFLEAYDPQEAGCLVLDVRMPKMDGLEVQQHLSKHGIGLPIIFLTAHGDVPTCAQAMKGGAFDFLEKPVDDELLLDLIQKAVTRRVNQGTCMSAGEYASRMSRLTPREKTVLGMLVAGRSLKETASACEVTVQTVWRHRQSILQKMGVVNDVELVRLATQAAHNGLR